MVRNFSPTYGLLALSITVACIAAYPILFPKEHPAVVQGIHYQASEKILVLHSTEQVQAKLFSQPMNGYYRHILDLRNATLGNGLPSGKELSERLRETTPGIQSISIQEVKGEQSGDDKPMIRLIMDMVDQKTRVSLLPEHHGRIGLRFLSEEKNFASQPPVPIQSPAANQPTAQENPIIAGNSGQNPVHPLKLPEDGNPQMLAVTEATEKAARSLAAREKMVAEKDAEIEALRHKIQTLRKAEYQLSRKIQTAATAHENTPVNTPERDSEMDYLRKESESLQSTLQQFKKKEQSVGLAKSAVESKLHQQEKENKILQGQLQSLKKQYAQLSKRPDTSPQVDVLTQKYETEVQRNRQLETALSQEKKHEAALERTAQNPAALPDAELLALKNQLQQAKKGLNSAIKTIADQNNELGQLKQHLNMVREGVDDTAKEQLSLLTGKLEDRETEVAQLKKKVAVLQGHPAGQPVLDREETADSGAYKDQYFEVKKQFENTQEQIKLLKKAHEAELSALKLTIQDREQQLNQVAQGGSEGAGSSAMVALQQRNNQLQNQLSELSSQVQTLQAENTTLKQSAKSTVSGNKQLSDASAGNADTPMHLAAISPENQEPVALSAIGPATASASDESAGMTDNASGKTATNDVKTLKKSLKSLQRQYQEIAQDNQHLHEVLSAQKPQAKNGQENGYRYQLSQAEITITDLRDKLAQLQKQKTPASKKTESAQALQKENERLSTALSKTEKELAAEKEALQHHPPVQVAQAQLNLAEGAAASSWRPDPEAERLTGILQQAAALRGQQKFDAAITAYRQAYQLAPENMEAILGLTALLVDQGQAQEALPILEQYITAHPQDSSGYNMLGKAYLATNKPETAQKMFAQAISLSALNNYAATLKQVGRTAEAEQVFRFGLTLNPQDSNLLFNLGNLYNATNRMEQAKETYLQALRLKPDFSMAHYNLALVFAKLGDKASAIEHLDQYLRLEPQAENKQEIQAYLAHLKS